MSEKDRGALAIVLHTHMPYVEGFGTWPFGEEWLWEAIATSYLPLLDVLDRAPFTLSITPVLADQLEAKGVADRFYKFIDEVRVETHTKDAADLRKQGLEAQAEEIERSAEDYAAARERMESIGGDLIGALSPFVTSTSSATHAILPLLATDALVRAQVETGVLSHRRRFGDPSWFWLPECAYDDDLDELLLESGIDAVCVDLTDTYGYNDTRNLYPLVKESGLTLVPVDRGIFELAWSDGGYPSKAAYRDSHRLTYFHHRPYANSGESYDREAALRQAHEDAAEFVAATIARLDAAAQESGRLGLSVATFDTEFFGHWWFEGVEWLRAVAAEAEKQGLEIVSLADGVERSDPVDLKGSVGASSWGTPRDLSTWDNTETADMVWQGRRAELELVERWPEVSPRTVRELLALQSSDWTFLETRETAGPYPRERAAGHAAKFTESLGDLQSTEGSLRNLAPDLSLRV